MQRLDSCSRSTLRGHSLAEEYSEVFWDVCACAVLSTVLSTTGRVAAILWMRCARCCCCKRCPPQHSGASAGCCYRCLASGRQVRIQILSCISFTLLALGIFFYLVPSLNSLECSLNGKVLRCVVYRCGLNPICHSAAGTHMLAQW